MKLFSPGEPIGKRVVHAGSWAFALHVADRLFGLGRTIVLARLLSPEDFGLFGIATLAIIQKKVRQGHAHRRRETMRTNQKLMRIRQ